MTVIERSWTIRVCSECGELLHGPRGCGGHGAASQALEVVVVSAERLQQALTALREVEQLLAQSGVESPTRRVFATGNVTMALQVARDASEKTPAPAGAFTLVIRRGERVLATRTALTLREVWLDPTLDAFPPTMRLLEVWAGLRELTEDGGTLELPDGITATVTRTGR